MAYGDFKHLNRKIFTYKVLRDKAFNIAKDPKYDRYHPGLASMVYKCFNEKASGSRINNENISNKELAEELHKQLLEHLICFIDIGSKYAWAIPLKDKKGITIINAFEKYLDKSNCKPNKTWADKGSEFYNRSIKSWLEINVIEMHSRHNEIKAINT